MKKQRVDKYVETEVKKGKTHQEIYDHIIATSTFKIHDIAEIVRKIPTLEKREKYKGMNVILLSLLAITVVHGMILIIENGRHISSRMLYTFPPITMIVSAILFYCIYNYKRNMHLVLGIWSILRSLESLNGLLREDNLYFFINLIISIIMIVLSFYLSVKVVSDYTFNKDLQQQNPERREGLITFKD
ncbi:MAG TPA: hypothetical protein VFF27_00655 [Bacteroidia bacterium]|jgi:hypothetical protein|nr:hypothetical protein [Bacteroidia bacterium]